MKRLVIYNNGLLNKAVIHSFKTAQFNPRNYAYYSRKHTSVYTILYYICILLYILYDIESNLPLPLPILKVVLTAKLPSQYLLVIYYYSGHRGLLYASVVIKLTLQLLFNYY